MNWRDLFGIKMNNGVPGKAVVQSISTPSRGGSIRFNANMWLDVYVEGWQPYRIRHSAFVYTSKYPSPGRVIPVRVDPARPERIEIVWSEIPTTDEMMRASGPGVPPALAFGGATVIDTRQDPKLRKQMLNMLAAQGIDVETLRRAQASGSDQPPTEADHVAQLAKLAELHASGALTDAEFAAAKQRLLDYPGGR